MRNGNSGHGSNSDNCGNSASGPDMTLPKDWQQTLVNESRFDIYKLGAWG